VPYRGFTWNLTYSDARQIAELLERYVMSESQPFRAKIDRKIASDLIVKAYIFMELSPDGATPTHGPADC